MNWWVYEDDATSWVRVHRAICEHCNDGRGRYATRLAPTTAGTVPTRREQEAIDKALSTGKRDVKGCGTCLPELCFLR